MDDRIFVTSTLSGQLTIPERVYIDTDKYEGSYVFDPTTEIQEIQIKDKVATQNIIINPIPSNYGLITWDGNALTIS